MAAAQVMGTFDDCGSRLGKVKIEGAVGLKDHEVRQGLL